MGYSIKHNSNKVSGVFVQYSWSYPIGVKTSDGVKTSAGTLYMGNNASPISVENVQNEVF